MVSGAWCRVLSLLVLTCFAVGAANAEAGKGQEPEMVKVGELMRSIYPMIVRSQRELSPEQVARLRQDVIALSSHIENTSRQKSGQTDTFKLTMQTMREHLASAEKLLGQNEVKYARSLLRSTTSLCSSCHTQDAQGRIFSRDGLKVAFEDPLAVADYYYMTRNYTEALNIYRNYIGELKRISMDGDTVEVLTRPLVIYTQIELEPDSAESYLKWLLSEKKLDKYLERRIQRWLQGVAVVKAAKVTSLDYAALAGMMKEHILLEEEQYVPLPEEKRVVAMWLRGLLHHYLNTSPAREEVPVILYWLAVIDRALDYNLFYSMADLYLKQCIVGYTEHPYAGNCFNLYKDYVNFSFTGSSGTHIPEPVLEELDRLENLLRTRGK